SVFDNNLFSDYWYQSEEIPSFLAELIKPGLADLRVFRNEESIVPSHNTIVLGEQLKPIPVLFQSGYLTAT
ncbi:MAG: AAA family ATPase, partial [Deltaproteobacteria bacterium]|nr:AAA family ATPase [Deltaproteobacteria bacterium]